MVRLSIIGITLPPATRRGAMTTTGRFAFVVAPVCQAGREGQCTIPTAACTRVHPDRKHGWHGKCRRDLRRRKIRDGGDDGIFDQYKAWWSQTPKYICGMVEARVACVKRHAYQTHAEYGNELVRTCLQLSSAAISVALITSRFSPIIRSASRNQRKCKKQ
ncbi:hypothetical protein BGZ61DRAFT_520600 [Ilyonectria robusta]|uniref:uncharacterized protein n=1 Tax=Ilyonectria robusta TaxID=1079257 RepID=UPI001E8E222D|nr:uncharacterized protein BGZ61DRAFT_520600 [Ilyonectria robusta]KAH8677040.1 hypothetical protein BGZ61DRAFT_520600 [Ilyonectria robusta]